MSELAGLLTGAAALLGVVGGIPGYLRWRSRREKQASVGTSFDAIIQQLGGDEEVQRLAAAVLLRRFFDPRTEFGEGGLPYAREAVNVIAAVLRREPSGDFQKLLADGLAYAPTLKGADLQRTNLQSAYLGSRDGRTVDLSGADFYRADLSRASLKGATAVGAVFYQARLNQTVLSRADLRDANFFEADLEGCRFAQTRLEGATFADARHLPDSIVSHLDSEGRYRDGAPFSEAGTSEPKAAVASVFLSKPGLLTRQQEETVAWLASSLQASGIDLRQIDRPDYPRVNAIGEIKRVMSGCVGVIVLCLRELEIRDGVWRAGTVEERTIRDEATVTPWTQIEAGMAIGLDLPVLVVADGGLTGGVLDIESGHPQLFRTEMHPTGSAAAFPRASDDWLAAVRERSRR